MKGAEARILSMRYSGARVSGLSRFCLFQENRFFLHLFLGVGLELGCKACAMSRKFHFLKSLNYV
jgi:hypothetical protein